MPSMKLILVLAIGTVLMWIPMLILSSQCGIKKWKTVPAAILLTIAGTVGTYIWYYIENQGIGRSFYGAIFMVPVFFVPVAKILRVPYGSLLDLCAPAECVMLSIMKIQCLIDGCCGGVVLFVNADNVPVCFPSQMVEMGNAVLVFALLMILAYRKQNRAMIYPWYAVIYGISRLVLNQFRANTSPFFLGMAPGTLWSLCAIILGGGALICCRRLKKQGKSL